MSNEPTPVKIPAYPLTSYETLNVLFKLLVKFYGYEVRNTKIFCASTVRVGASKVLTYFIKFKT